MTELAAAWDRVFSLAEQGRYSTSPNPRVGAVVLGPGGEIAGEGSHERAGGLHAEATALATAGARARGGTVLVNLEPCAHHGRTPPCADALVAAGVARVVYSLRDPDPRTAGRGASRLREAGIVVEEGPRAEAAERLNEPFLTSVRKGRPYVHLKWAASLDGHIGTFTGASRWITGEPARNRGMLLREECDAIVVGAGTVQADDPLLTRRVGRNRSILPHRRVVLDGRLRLTGQERVFAPAAGEVWLVTARPEDDPSVEPFRRKGVQVRSLPSGDSGEIDLQALLGVLAGLEVRSVLVEGGGETAWRFLAAGLADRVSAFVSPLLLGGRTAPVALGGTGFATIPEAARLVDVERESIGDDVLLSGRVERSGGAG